MAYTPADRFYRFTWDTSAVRALGATTSGEIELGNLPTTFRATRSGWAVKSGFNGVASLTMQLGWNSLRDNLLTNVSVDWEATRYVNESDFQRVGLGLTPYIRTGGVLPADEVVPLYAKFTSGGGNLNDTTGSEGVIWIEGFEIVEP